MVLQPIKAMLVKGFKNVIDMRARELETVGDALFVPAFLGHPYDRPSGLIGIAKTRKGGQVEFELQRCLVGLEKPFEGVMVGLIAEFVGQDALDLA